MFAHHEKLYSQHSVLAAADHLLKLNIARKEYAGSKAYIACPPLHVNGGSYRDFCTSGADFPIAVADGAPDAYQPMLFGHVKGARCLDKPRSLWNNIVMSDLHSLNIRRP